MPPGKSPSLYDIKKTTVWFLISSFILAVGLVAMVIQDSTRDWKTWQRKFMDYSREKAQAELAEAKKAVDSNRLEALKAELAAAEEKMKAQKNEIKSVKKEILKLNLEHTKTNTEYQTLKQFQDSDRYFYEEHMIHGEQEKAKPIEAAMIKREAEINAAKLELERIEALKEQAEAKLAAFSKDSKAAQDEITKLTKEQDRISANIKKLTPNWQTEILNAPMLDFMNPTLRIQQIVVENLKDDYYFARVEKVDRCTSCHLAIDQKGFEDAPQPFTTHPNLELFISADSSHPMEAFGCTTCHGGSGHSANFVMAAHTPENAEQAEEWKKKYHWKPLKHWSEKMFPMTHIEASCAKCHTGVVEIPQADKLNEGRRLAGEFGCFGCHKVGGFEDRWKAGPGLTHVQSKLEEDWIVRWLHNPKEFRPSTKMPRIFHLSNTMDPESVDMENAAIAGIASYLIKNSEPIALQSTSIAGDAAKGEKLVQEVGCLGCHTAGTLSANHHGPELSGLGSKVKKNWLFDWLKNPSHYYPETRMPNLRLSDEEAAHIASYLLQDKNEKFESIRLPLIKPEAVDQLAIGFMTGMMRHQDAKDALGKMSDTEKLEYVGSKVIGRQGCYACHDIKGFESAKPVGTELTLHGSKDVHKLDFGFAHIEHTRQAWFHQKLKEPRIFDHGKVKTYYDKLRMPQFDFTDEQADALTTFLLSLQKAEIPLEMQKVLSTAEMDIEKGRLLVSKLNCQGCHTMDGKEGGVRAIIEDTGLAPPILDGEGAKVQEAWLYHFLDRPVTIRPWLSYRMPTFGLDHDELLTVVKYFNHLSGVSDTFVANEVPETTPEIINAGRELFKTFQCIKCHQAEVPAGLSASFLAPNLVMAKDRLRPDWMVEWLKDPQLIQEGTMMPTFFYDGQSPVQDVLEGDAEKQIKAIRDYMMIFSPEEAAKINQPAAQTN